MITGILLAGSFFLLYILKRALKKKDELFSEGMMVFGYEVSYSIAFGLGVSIIVTVINALLVLFLTFLTRQEGHYSRAHFYIGSC